MFRREIWHKEWRERQSKELVALLSLLLAAYPKQSQFERILIWFYLVILIFNDVIFTSNAGK